MNKRLKKLVPKILRPLLFDRPASRNDMIPPKSLSFVGKGDFEKIGREFRQHFIALAGLRPEHRVLDVGCGIGRMAIPLTEYLSPAGGYWGFDIVRKGIDWCSERITPKFPNFQFRHSDVYNQHYNPGGTVRACDYRFPFEDNFFDFVFLTSVFTHMVPADLEAAIAYDEATALRFFTQCGLAVEPPVRHGSWCGRARFLSYQDIVVAAKR